MKKMSDYVINTFMESERDSSKHTVFENPNKELKAMIMAFNPEINTYEKHFPPSIWDIGEIEDGQYKCTSGKNIQYFDVEEIESYRADKKIRLLNREFPPDKWFKKCFGIVTLLYADDNTLNYKQFDLNDFGKFCLPDDDVDYTSVNFFGTFTEYNLCKYYSWHSPIGFKFERSGSSTMSLYFNTDGNFVNRDYNVKLQDYSCTDISYEYLLDELQEFVLTFKPFDGDEFLYSRGKYYGAEYMYELIDLEYDITRRDDENSYKNGSGYPRKKLPKRVERKTHKDMLEELNINIEKFKANM